MVEAVEEKKKVGRLIYTSRDEKALMRSVRGRRIGDGGRSGESNECLHKKVKGRAGP